MRHTAGGGHYSKSRMSYPSVHTGDHNTKTTDMQPTENTPTPCQCDICLERDALATMATEDTNTPPTPTETILDDPDATAGHAGGGADATTVAISKTGECDPDPTPEVGAMVPNICREKESFYPPAEQGHTKVSVCSYAILKIDQQQHFNDNAVKTV